VNTLEGRAWRALAAARGAGPKTLWRIAGYLAARRQPASRLLENPDELRAALMASKAAIGNPGPIDPRAGEIETFAGQKPVLLYPLHPLFPRRIMDLSDKMTLPALLYAAGNLSLLERPGVAIVGMRNAAKPALAVADALASGLAASGIQVVSGYASGIDSAAHLAALRANGTTGIVLSEGIGRFRVKPEIKEFVTKENTLVVSQFEPNAPWAAYMAMARNKLVCALSNAVVVVVSGPERGAGGKMSGSFAAAMAALKLGIPAFTVSPGFFPDVPAGNRELIARGCRAWDPADGTAAIIAALDAAARKKPSGQRSLFEESGS
jgi:DNA processing protein